MSIVPSYVEVVVDKMQGLGAPAQPESHLTALQNSVLEIAFMSLLVPLLPQNCSKLFPMNFGTLAPTVVAYFLFLIETKIHARHCQI